MSKCSIAHLIQPTALFYARKFFPDIEKRLGPYEPEFESPDRPEDYTARLRETTHEVVLSDAVENKLRTTIPVKALVECDLPHCRHQVTLLAIFLDSAAWVTTPKAAGSLEIKRRKTGTSLINHRSLVITDSKTGAMEPHQCVNFKFGIDSNMCRFKEPVFMCPPGFIDCLLLERQRNLPASLEDPQAFLLEEDKADKPIPSLLSFYMHDQQLHMSDETQALNTPANKEKVAEQLKLHQHTFSPWSSYCLNPADDLLDVSLDSCREKVPLPSRLMVRLRFIYIVL